MRAALVTAALTCGLLGAGAAAQNESRRLTFDAVSIKANRDQVGAPGMTAPPGRFTATNMWVRFIIQNAWGIRDDQILGAPDWLTRDRFDIVATTGGVTNQVQTMSMLRSMLEDRFKLVAAMEIGPYPVYRLEMKDSSGLKPSAPDCQAARRTDAQHCGWSMAMLLLNYGRYADRPIVDKTGLTERYDFDLQFARPTAPGALAADGTPFRTALQDQLGLKLEPTVEPFERLVIRSIERPTED